MKTILIPGFGGSNRLYTQYNNAFSDFHVLETNIADTMSEYFSMLDSLIIEKSNIIGLSWGGIIALQYAQNKSEKINKLLIIGAGRKLHTPKELQLLMNLPGILYYLAIIGFVMLFPLFFVFDRNGYRQKYGGLGILSRLGWRKTKYQFNQYVKTTRFEGKISHPTLLLNLETDFLIQREEIEDLQSDYTKVKFIPPPDKDHIHFTHELDELIIREACEFFKEELL
ncbi:MAG: alpha/beta fold hydrolase [Candidatus Heimdallarchaeota archaeon]|nr:alpha/beta fold hydrolase [Candidatus Heimdallarchaeota archaeon]